MSLLQNSRRIGNFRCDLMREKVEAATSGMIGASETLITPALMNDSTPCRIMTRWNVVQHELLPELEARWGG